MFPVQLTLVPLIQVKLMFAGELSDSDYLQMTFILCKKRRILVDKQIFCHKSPVADFFGGGANGGNCPLFMKVARSVPLIVTLGRSFLTASIKIWEPTYKS